MADRQSVVAAERGGGDGPCCWPSGCRHPVVVGENRFEAGRHAVETVGASVVVLDDGFRTAPSPVSRDRGGERPVAVGQWPLSFPAAACGLPLSRLRRGRLVKVVTNPRGDGEDDGGGERARCGCTIRRAPVARLRALRARGGASARERRGRACRSRGAGAAAAARLQASSPRQRSFMETARGAGHPAGGLHRVRRPSLGTDGDLAVARRSSARARSARLAHDRRTRCASAIRAARTQLWIYSRCA